MTNGNNARTFHTVRDVAASLYVTPNTIYNRIRRGDIAAVVAGPRKTLIPDGELQRLLAEAGLSAAS